MYDPTKPHNSIIIEQAKRTWGVNNYIRVHEDGYFRRHSPNPTLEIDHTDGIGHKGFFHWEHKTFRNAVLDALAMNLNDLLMYRATPYKLQNHLYLPEDDADAIREIATALADECVRRNIAITGGECAFHGLGLEISITLSGIIGQRYSNSWEEGDVLIGLASTGLHSNGATLASKLAYFDPAWLTPTRIYELPIWPCVIKGIQHITGGAFTKLKKRLTNVDAYIHRDHSLDPQDVFTVINSRLYKHSYTEEMMYKTFNCGIGMVLAVDRDNASNVIAKVGGEVIGELKKGNGNVIIESKFSDKTFKL